MKNAPLFLGFLLFWTFGFLFAQNDDNQASLDNGTLEEQYEYLTKRSGNYRANGIRYEVIRLSSLTKFKDNLMDSIADSKESLIELRSNLAENATEIEALKSKLAETTENLNTLTAEKDSMSFFGSSVSKSTYKGIVWSIILVLIVTLALFVYKFRKSNFLTVQAKSALAELEEEFEQHRRRALEREQVISRKLQDEINKNKKGSKS